MSTVNLRYLWRRAWWTLPPFPSFPPACPVPETSASSNASLYRPITHTLCLAILCKLVCAKQMTSQDCSLSLVDGVILWVQTHTHTHTHLTQEFTESQEERMQLLFLSHFLPLALSHQFGVFPSSLQQILQRQPQITAHTHTRSHKQGNMVEN